MSLIVTVRNHSPKVHPSAWMAPNATVIGQVEIGLDCSLWFSCVIRGDVAPIRVGQRVNIQDGAVVHGTFEQSQTVLEDDVSIGHNAIVHGAHVKKGALVGMGATVMDHAVIGPAAVVAAGAVVLAHTVVGEGELWAGVPARCKGKVSPELRDHLAQTAARYVEYASWFQSPGEP